MTKDTIQFEDFAKLDIRIGTITSAEKIDGADKLLKFMVDIGGARDRQIISGIAEYFSDPKLLIVRQVPTLINLKPRVIRGYESEGMILYVVGDSFLYTLEPSEKNIPSGTPIQ